MMDKHWGMKPNLDKALMIAKRQLEFNTKMLTFYESGNQEEMNLFLKSCLDPKIVQIMKEI